MKVNRILFLVLIALISFSCKTVKEATKTSLNQNTEQYSASNLDTESKKDVEIITVVTDKGVTTNSTTIKTTTTELSPPDAKGKQHPTKVTHTEQTSNTKQEADTKNDTKAQSLTQNKAKGTKASASKTDLNQKAEDEKQTETPTVVYLILFLVAIGILVFIYLVLKRFNVIK